MKIVVKLDSEISEEEKEEILDFIDICFGISDREKRKKLYFSKTFKRLFLYENSELVSYLRLIIRETQFNSKNIRIGGIGDVATHPDHRGKKYATELLKKAHQLLMEEKCDVGLLQTNPKLGAKLYETADFRVINRSYTFNDKNGALHSTKAESVMMAPLRSVDIFNTIVSSDKMLHIGDGDW